MDELAEEREAPSNRYLQCLGEMVLEKLRQLHMAGLGYRYGEIGSAMTAVFGHPDRCLVCAKPLGWADERRVPDDVDPWFCAGCCPICSDDDELGKTG